MTRPLDTDATLDIPLSPVRTALAILLLLAVTSGGLLMALDPEVGRRSPEFTSFIGWTAGTLCGLLTAMHLWQLVALRGPILTLSPEGLWDRRLLPDPIPWRDVDSISAGGYGVLVVALEAGPGC